MCLLWSYDIEAIKARVIKLKRGIDMGTLSTKKDSSIHWAWVVLAVCFVDLYINYGIRLGYSVLLPEMIRTMGFTRRQGGDIFNAYFLVYIIFSLFTGYFTDRLGARRVISLFCIILGIGTILMGTAKSFWQACIFYGIVGMGEQPCGRPLSPLSRGGLL